jgi:hypothetical protein
MWSIGLIVMVYGMGVWARVVKGRGRRSKWHAGRRPSSVGHRGSVSPDQLVARISPGEAGDNHALHLASGSAGLAEASNSRNQNRPLMKNPVRGNPQTGFSISLNQHPEKLGRNRNVSRKSIAGKSGGKSEASQRLLSIRLLSVVRFSGHETRL